MADPKEEYREIRLPKSSLVTEEIIYQLNLLFTIAPPGEFRETLIEIYHSYIIREHEMLPLNFHTMAHHVNALIEFLKLADKERNHRQD
jgi:hypothetical protein